MATRLQTKAVRNEVLRYIKQLGLDPDQFYWDEVASRYMDLRVSQICHKSEEYFYTFDYDDNNLRYSAIGIMSPGTDFSPSVVLTLDTYSHVLPSMQKAATDKLAGMLFPIANVG